MSARKIISPLAALAVIAGMGLTACSSGTQSGSASQSGSAEGSGGGGSLTLACSNQEDWCQFMANAYQEATGVKTNYVRLSGGEALARLQSAKDTPEFDVWYGAGADQHEAGNEAGVIEPYVSPAADETPDAYKDPNGVWVGIYGGMVGFCSNTDKLADLGLSTPESWDDLLKPEYKQEVAVSHPGTSSTAYTFLWTQYVLNGEDQAKTFDYLKQLNNNVLQYAKTGAAPGQMAGRSEIATGIIFSQDCVKYQKEGMPLELSFPKEGTGYEIGAISLVKGSKNMEGAKAFMDWALSAEAQNLYPEANSYQIPINSTATADPAVLTFDKVKLIDMDMTAAGDMKKELVDAFTNEIATAPKE